jgi:hypothetical protein
MSDTETKLMTNEQLKDVLRSVLEAHEGKKWLWYGVQMVQFFMIVGLYYK